MLGIPAVITTDQGKEFHNKLNKGFEVEMGIDHRFTTAYHPQANGLDERFNQTMKYSIAKFLMEKIAPGMYKSWISFTRTTHQSKIGVRGSPWRVA